MLDGDADLVAPAPMPTRNNPVCCHPPAEQHAEPGDEGRRLAAAGRGDDLGRPIGQRRGRPLLGIERRQQAVNR
jgi:hypothetical protein